MTDHPEERLCSAGHDKSACKRKGSARVRLYGKSFTRIPTVTRSHTMQPATHQQDRDVFYCTANKEICLEISDGVMIDNIKSPVVTSVEDKELLPAKHNTDMDPHIGVIDSLRNKKNISKKNIRS